MNDWEQTAAAGAGDVRAQRLDGIVIGMFSGFDASRQPLVIFPGNGAAAACVARTTAVLTADDAGCEVALLFENGDPGRPLIIGRIQRPEQRPEAAVAPAGSGPVQALIDGEKIEFNAQREIVLRCGKASITLTRAGKVLIRGSYVLSRSSGANRIKGGSVQIN